MIRTDDVERLFKESLAEMERLLSSKSTVGEAIQIGDATVIPLLAIGFGYGAGGGNDGKTNSTGTGTGAGGGVKPIALLISDKDGVRIERVNGPSGFQVLGNTIVRVMEQQQKKEKKAEPKAA